jgi:putative ABC transport system substrate-binding protein
VLVTGFGTLAAKAAKAATSTIPIVFTVVGDPIGAGLVASLARPGVNVTGMTDQASDVVGKRLQLLRELIPGNGTIAVLSNPDTPFSALALQELRAAARAGTATLMLLEARTADQMSAGFETAAKAGTAGLLLLEDPLTYGLRRRIALSRATAVRRGCADMGAMSSKRESPVLGEVRTCASNRLALLGRE